MGVSEWHRNSGVCSQYGYEFQKYAFIYYMMKYHNLYNVYIYEKDDDCVIKGENKTILIQCKTAIKEVKTDKIDKIFDNWFHYYNNNKNQSIKFILHTDNNFKKDNAIKKIRKKNIYDENSINYIFDNFEYINKNDVELFDEIKEILITTYFNNTINSNVQNDITLTFINQMYLKLKDKIINSKKDNREHGEFFLKDIINVLAICYDYKDNFGMDIKLAEKYFKKEIDKLLSSSISREVLQLKNINIKESRIITLLTCMMIYDNIKTNYGIDESASFNNNEITAYTYYEDILDLNNFSSNKELFNSTIKNEIKIKHITDELNKLVSDGCYIYLTKEETPDDRKITWDIK